MKKLFAVAFAFCLGVTVSAQAQNAVPYKLTDSFDETRAAAERGDASAQTHLGYMYAEGRIVQQDHVQAAVWLRKAAVQGFVTAQYSLGLMYANGRGVPQDYAQAAAWYRKAADQGDDDSQEELRKLKASGLIK